jgi:hypothetical protein
MKLSTVFGLLTVIAMSAMGGNGNFWDLPKDIETACIIIFAMGFGYFVAWPQIKEIYQSSRTEYTHCSKCGQKLPVGTRDEDDKTA